MRDSIYYHSNQSYDKFYLFSIYILDTHVKTDSFYSVIRAFDQSNEDDVTD